MLKSVSLLFPYITRPAYLSKLLGVHSVFIIAVTPELVLDNSQAAKSCHVANAATVVSPTVIPPGNTRGQEVILRGIIMCDVIWNLSRQTPDAKH